MQQQFTVIVMYYISGIDIFYISAIPRRSWDKKIVPRTSKKITDAFQCADQDHADRLINQMFNAATRQYKTEPYEIWKTVPSEPKPKRTGLFIAHKKFS